MLARWGSDEFLVLLTSPRIRADLDALHERISVALAAPLSVAGTPLCVTSSMGVALYPQDGDTIEILLRTWKVEGQAVRPDHRMVAHTGFLTSARLLGPVPGGLKATRSF